MANATTESQRKNLGCLVFFVAIAVILPLGYFKFDSLGWIQHTADSSITAQGNWFVGESKECQSFPLQSDLPQGEDKGYALTRINCDEGPLHDVKITFYGRKAQPEYSVVMWKCTREEGGFECYERGGVKMGQ